MMTLPAFADRRSAGQILARRLDDYAGRNDAVVLALPRGGVPVAYEVARALRAPLDVFIVRKLGFPGHEELAIGAIASGGTIVVDPNFVLGLSREQLDAVTRKEYAELRRREQAYRDDRQSLDISGKTVIVVDDGLATGASMHAAVRALRERGAARIVVAVPVASPHAVESLKLEAHEVVAALIPDGFYAVGAYYEDFTQTTDEEVRELLRSAAAA